MWAHMLRCNHKEQQTTTTNSKKREVEAMKKTLADIQKTMKELAEFTAMQAELEAQIESLKDELKEFMKAANVDELLGENGEHAVWRKVISNRFDSTAFKKSEWGELYKEFTKPSETRPFKFFA